MPVRDWLFWYCFAVLMVSLIPLFFWVVEPSLLGKTRLRVWFDAPVYLWEANVDTDPALFAETWSTLGDSPRTEIDWADAAFLYSNHLGPVGIAYLMGTNFKIMLFNCGLFFLSLLYLSRLNNIRFKLLIFLLLLNPITILSLLSVTKEIVVLLATALFAYYLRSRSPRLLPLVLVISLLARWEQGASVIIWLLLDSRLNPWRRHRLASIMLVVAGVSVVSPFVLGSMLDNYHDLGGGQLVLAVDRLQQAYLFPLVLVPKTILSSSQALLAVSEYRHINWYDVPNSYTVLWNGVLVPAIAIALLAARRLKLTRDYVYIAVLFTIIVAAAPLIQFRFLYSPYIFACIELATRREREPYRFESVLRKHGDSLAAKTAFA